MRSATSTTASIGSSATICAISLPGHRERRLADLDRHVGDDAGPRRAHDAAVALGVRGGECGFRRPVKRLGFVDLQPGKIAACGEVALGFEIDLALVEKRARLRHLGFARFVGQNGDDVALFDEGAALDLQLGDDAAGARGRRDAPVGFGAAGQDQLAAMRLRGGLDDADAKQLLRRGLAGTDGGAALVGFVRQQVTGGDPKAGRDDQAERGNATCFHRTVSSICGLPRSMWRTTSMKIVSTASALKFGIAGATAPDAVGDQHQHGYDLVEIDVGADLAAYDAFAQHGDQPRLDVAIEALMDPRDLRIAAGSPP